MLFYTLGVECHSTPPPTHPVCTRAQPTPKPRPPGHHTPGGTHPRPILLSLFSFPFPVPYRDEAVIGASERRWQRGGFRAAGPKRQRESTSSHARALHRGGGDCDS